MEEKLELADQKVAQLSKLPEVQHELTGHALVVDTSSMGFSLVDIYGL